MNRPWRILHLEDDPDFSELVCSLLKQEGLQAELTLVETREAFQKALAEGEYDAVLADYLLPSYNGIEALRWTRTVFPETPFLLVSGTIGEAAAIESLKSGATDYVLKHWPERLPAAVRRALDEAQERKQRRKAETELVRREATLRESEKQYRLIFEGNPTPMWVFDHATLKFLEVNDAAIQHYGYSRDEFLQMSIEDLRPAEDGPAMIEYVHRLAASNHSDRMGFAGVWRHRKRDGTLIDVEIKWSPIVFRGAAASLTMANDVTERRRVERRDATLSKLGQRLSSATSADGAARIIKEVADDLFRWDAFTLDLYSTEADEMHPILDIDTDRAGGRFEIPVDGDERKPTRRARRIIEHGAELILRDDPVTMSDDVEPIGDTGRASASLLLAPIRNQTKVIGLLSIQSYSLRAYNQQDLTTLQLLADHCAGALERIRAEQALHQSEERFRDLFEHSPDAIFVEDSDGQVLDVNPAACSLHGWARKELVGKNVSELVPPEMRESVPRDFKALVEGVVQQVESLSWTQNQRAVPVEVRASRVEYAGQPAVLLHVRDITERKLAEAALRSSEMLFHSVWENSVDGMRLTDEAGCIVAVNEAFCKLVRLPRQELEGSPFTVIYAESEATDRLTQEYRQRFQERVVENQSERSVTLRDGQAVTLASTNSFVELQGGAPLLLGLFRDVTAQKRLEAQLRQSQKMEAIGQLAGGVAHDFNNILTVIRGHASLLQAGGGLTVPAARSASQITQAADRAASLTRQLLAFSRRQIMQPRQLDMNEVVGNLTKMLGRILGEDIALQLHYSTRPALIRGDAGMIEQVLLNLVVNSRDAMPRGGLLSIRINLRDPAAGQPAHLAHAGPGAFVCLAVSDTGIGIAPENLARIFEPFFTTKEVGKGTGLGLATVYGIIEQHQGWVEVDSHVGKGSTFRVFLPCCNGQPAEPAEPANRERPVRGGTETILVVEDETPVRELVCDLLAGYGYHILQAESGLKALSVWKSCAEKVDLLLTDLVMPDRVNGRELAERLLKEKPELKVIFTSGYSAEVVGKDFILQSGLNYLQKPYSPQKLALTVRDCLDGSEGS